MALAVIAFAMAAAISAVSGTSRNAAGLQQRTYAHWVAMNKMTELQVNKTWPAMTTTRGSSLLANHEWFWTMKVSSAPDKSVRRVDITVNAEEDAEYSLVTLTGFVVQQ